MIVDKDKPITRPGKGMFLKGSVIAAIITIPSLIAFFIVWSVTDDVITSAIVGTIVHFIGLGFSFKISKRLFKIKTS
jgi:hypothetical protein